MSDAVAVLLTVYGIIMVGWFICWTIAWDEAKSWDRPNEEITRAARMILATPVSPPVAICIAVGWLGRKIVHVFVDAFGDKEDE